MEESVKNNMAYSDEAGNQVAPQFPSHADEVKTCIESGEVYAHSLATPNEFGKYSLTLNGKWYNSPDPIPVFIGDEEDPVPNPEEYERKKYNATVCFAVTRGYDGKERRCPRALGIRSVVEKDPLPTYKKNPFVS